MNFEKIIEAAVDKMVLISLKNGVEHYGMIKYVNDTNIIHMFSVINQSTTDIYFREDEICSMSITKDQ